tara:strand:- start:286 stop:477 length:192 start_codon:yes stop_codon:yes gene_type:complete
MRKKSKGMRNGGRTGRTMKSKGMRNGGRTMKSKGIRRGGKAKPMTLAQIRSAAKAKGYKLVKS